jgi:ApaG protein
LDRHKLDTADVKRSAGSDTTTGGIRVQAAAQYMPSESNPQDKQFIYAYRIVLTNVGTQRAKLKSRHWIILDADNHREDVKGPGVVGKTPDLGPGERFEYMSGCPLRTSWGTMEGTYLFERESGEQFEAVIGRFFLVPTAPKIASQVK